MTEQHHTRSQAEEHPADNGAHAESDRTPWRRPVVTRIPLAATLAGTGSVVDGFTGSQPS